MVSDAKPKPSAGSYSARRGLTSYSTRSVPPRWRAARDPESYALLALVPGVTPDQRARVLLRLRLESWANLDDDVRATLARVVRVLIHGLPGTVRGAR